MTVFSANIITSLFLICGKNSIMSINGIFFPHSTMDGHLGWFHSLTSRNVQVTLSYREHTETQTESHPQTCTYTAYIHLIYNTDANTLTHTPHYPYTHIHTHSHIRIHNVRDTLLKEAVGASSSFFSVYICLYVCSREWWKLCSEPLCAPLYEACSGVTLVSRISTFTLSSKDPPQSLIFQVVR